MPTNRNRDWLDLFAALNDAGVEYLVFGAHALAAHGHVRATKDLDVGSAPRSKIPSASMQPSRALAPRCMNSLPRIWQRPTSSSRWECRRFASTS